MMTIAKVERITRGQVTVQSDGIPGRVQCWLSDGSGKVIACSDPFRKASDALDDLVKKHYADRREDAFRRQRWRCFHCGRIVPLECDHIKSRARGQRLDTIENLRGLCHDHHVAHTDNKMTPTIHPTVADEAKKEGWAWAGEAGGWIRTSQ